MNPVGNFLLEYFARYSWLATPESPWSKAPLGVGAMLIRPTRDPWKGVFVEDEDAWQSVPPLAGGVCPTSLRPLNFRISALELVVTLLCKLSSHRGRAVGLLVATPVFFFHRRNSHLPHVKLGICIQCWYCRTELCRFSGAKIYPGRGIRFVRSDSQDDAQEAVRKRRRTTKKPYSRSIVGATLEVIQKRRTEKPEIRDAAREAALREIKERIKKTKDEKKAKKAEVMAKVQKSGGKGNVPKGAAPKGPKLGGGGGKR
ncbi:ribosomal protein L24e family protein [Actinidia rufa]|uniref:Ribosomal protein L24e family protein n=1 Tax=Actinidia rufa TaxID=165716 RepID=A0A7J0GIZ2_9ERIC|nr:ribosomal protein L24e family protein [Actinidia rufa]